MKSTLDTQLGKQNLMVWDALSLVRCWRNSPPAQRGLNRGCIRSREEPHRARGGLLHGGKSYKTVLNYSKRKVRGVPAAVLADTWLGELVCPVLYFTSTQTHSKYSSVVYNWLTEQSPCAWLTLALNLPCVKLFHLRDGILPLLLGFLLFNRYPFTRQVKLQHTFLLFAELN